MAPARMNPRPNPFRHGGMVTEIVQQYRETHAECCQLLDAAFRLSVSTQGREDVTRGLEVGSWLFAKLYSHAKAAVDLAPNGPLGGVVTAQELWDISSICLLYTSDAADDLLCVDLGGRRIIKQ